MTVIEFGQEPGFGEAPGALDGSLRKVHQFGDLAVFQSYKETQFDDFSLGWVLRSKAIKRFINMEELSRVVLACEINFVERDALAAAAVAKLKFPAGIIDQNATHALCRSAEEMRAILPILVRRSHQPKPGFVNERGRLERVAGSFTRHPVCGEFPQLIINQRQQFLGRFGITLLNAVQNVCDVTYIDRP
jgi:hypothetical protein